MKLDLDKKIDTYMFVIMVLIFVLLFCLMCSSQMKFTINKILENQPKQMETSTKTTYTPTTQSEINKYTGY